MRNKQTEPQGYPKAYDGTSRVKFVYSSKAKKGIRISTDSYILTIIKLTMNFSHTQFILTMPLNGHRQNHSRKKA